MKPSGGTPLQQCLQLQKRLTNYKNILVMLETAAKAPDGTNGNQVKWPGLRNCRRVWKRCQQILVQIEGRFAAVRKRSTVSPDLEEHAMFRVTGLCRLAVPTQWMSDAYFILDIIYPADGYDPLPPASITVYFQPDRSIIDIEWLLPRNEGCNLFGHRTSLSQSEEIHVAVTISAILLSLGPLDTETGNRTIRGFGILQDDKEELDRPLKLGSWTDNDLVHIYRPSFDVNDTGTTPRVTVISGKYNVCSVPRT